jgi:protein SCO1/2
MPSSARTRALVVFLAGLAVLAFGLLAWLWTGRGPISPSEVGSTASSGAARIGGPFALIDQHGRPRSDRDFRGRYLLIYFGYTYCPDFCPSSLMTMTAALDLLAGSDPALARQVTPILITIDPERDTVEALAAYATHFHESLMALTGTPAQIAAAAEVYRVYYAKTEDPGAGSYLMDHSTFIFLMDPRGRYLTHFAPGVTPEAIAEALKTIAVN